MEKNVKKLSGIKLNQLRKNELEKRTMNSLIGGSEKCTYWCGYYSDPWWEVSDCNLNSDLTDAERC